MLLWRPGRALPEWDVVQKMKTFKEFYDSEFPDLKKRNRMNNLVKLLNTTLWVAGIVLVSLNLYAGMVAMSVAGANTAQKTYDIYLIESEGALHRLERAPTRNQ